MRACVRASELGKESLTVTFYYFLVPIVQFERAAYVTKEDVGVLSVPLMRTGDLSFTSSVSCYTRQVTARVGEDFIERPDTEESIVTFKRGENRKECSVAVRNDPFYEGLETFRLVLRSVEKDVRIGERNQTVITITDTEDSEFQLPFCVCVC